jgi:hypothetical protein
VRIGIVFALALLATGCGGGAPAVQPGPTTASSVKKPARHYCSAPSRGFRACTAFGVPFGEQSRIEGRVDGRWAVVLTPREAPHPNHGWWRRVIASPNRANVLAQWSGECEIQTTYLVSPSTGELWSIFSGEASSAIGWTRQGRARVLLLAPIYGTDRRVRFKAGVYRIDPGTHAISLERSVGAAHGC